MDDSDSQLITKLSKQTGPLGTRLRILLAKLKKTVDTIDEDIRASRKGLVPYSMTVNVDPLHRHEGAMFDMMQAAGQKACYDLLFQQLMKKFKCIRELEVHYEGIKDRLHCHVIMWIVFGSTVDSIQKYVHDIVGRKGLRKSIACTINKIKTDEDYDTVHQYVNKENCYPCQSFIREKKDIKVD